MLHFITDSVKQNKGCYSVLVSTYVGLSNLRKNQSFVNQKQWFLRYGVFGRLAKKLVIERHQCL